MKVFSIPSFELVNFQENSRTDKDFLDRSSDLLLSPLHWAFGREVYAINDASKFELIEPERVRSSVFAAFLFLLTLPLTGTMTALGITARKLSSSYSNNYQELKNQVEDPDHRLGLSVYKKVIFEASLILKRIFPGIAKPWWNEIPYDLIKKEYPKGSILLGGLPLKEHQETLINELNVGAVICLTEKFENDGHDLHDTWAASPISPITWYKKIIDFKQYPSPDFHPVSQEKTQKAAEFLHNRLKEGKTVYLHCKGGKGRSAQVLIYFLVKYLNYSMEDAYQHVKKCRPKINFKQESQSVVSSLVLSGTPQN